MACPPDLACLCAPAGFLKHFSDLDDATKYAGIDFFMQFNQPPTNDTFCRAARFDNFYLHTGAPWERVEEENEQVGVCIGPCEHIPSLLLSVVNPVARAPAFLILCRALLYYADCHLVLIAQQATRWLTHKLHTHISALLCYCACRSASSPQPGMRVSLTLL